MKKTTLKAIENLSSRPSQNFIPLRHSNALDSRGEFNGDYDPYEIPEADDEEDQEEIDESILFGSIEILSVSYISSEEWRNNRELDSVLSDEYEKYYSEASSALTEKFGTYRFKGISDDYTTPFIELDKFITGDFTELKIWKPYGTYDEHYYLINSMSAGDGDILSILWLAHITSADYEPPKKRKLP